MIQKTISHCIVLGIVSVIFASHAHAKSFISRPLQLLPADQRNESATNQNSRKIRRMTVATPLQAGARRPWAAVFNDGAVVFGAMLEDKEQVLRICCPPIDVEEVKDWNCGAIDILSMSPSGRYIFFGEDNGRFCLVDTSDKTAAEYWLPVILSADDGTLTGLRIGTVSWLYGSDNLAISYVDGTIVSLHCESRKVVEVCAGQEVELPDIVTKDVTGLLPRALDAISLDKIEYDVKSNFKTPLTSKLLALGETSYAIGRFRGPLEMVSQKAGGVRMEAHWIDGLSVGPGRFLLFTVSGQTLKCHLRSLDNEVAAHDWVVNKPNSFNVGSLLVTSLAELPGGDLVVVSDAGQSCPVWQIELPSLRDESQMTEISRPSTFHLGDIAVADRDGVLFFGVDIASGGGFATLRRRANGER